MDVVGQGKVAQVLTERDLCMASLYVHHLSLALKSITPLSYPIPHVSVLPKLRMRYHRRIWRVTPPSDDWAHHLLLRVLSSLAEYTQRCLCDAVPAASIDFTAIPAVCEIPAGSVPLTVSKLPREAQLTLLGPMLRNIIIKLARKVIC